MNFRPERPSDDLEINLIPLIDVLLVILIFLAATTTFSRYSQLEVTLPQAQADASTVPAMLNISVSRDGVYAMDGRLLSGNTTQDIVHALQATARNPDTALVISADAHATHDSVIRVMEAARLAGIERLNFATQSAQ
ncbi:MAG TPA: biopolymer transporter ExbD [Burkholderiaceae bacterium]|nr:biopolymer transporter ExbD [Burkholderiaceae bacterium]